MASSNNSASSVPAERSKSLAARNLATRNWDQAHTAQAATSPDNGSSSVPSRLYTDENPATTIKGTGFKNRAVAERTIRLTAQPGVRYKQYWTIRAMRERAVHHPHQTDGMRDAILVFDEWLGNYTDPSAEQRKDQQKEWEDFRRLCNSVANRHAYGKVPTQDELKRARQDLQEGQKILVDLLSVGLRSSCKGKQNENGLLFPITKFTALFGGPGVHGYGQHNIANSSEQMADDNIPYCYPSSRIDIDGAEGVEELIGKAKATKIGLLAANIQIIVRYNRIEETATVEVEQGRSGTLKALWRKGAQRNDAIDDKNNTSKTHLKEAAVDAGRNSKNKISWACATCTFVHEGEAKASFLVCELCGSERKNADNAGSIKTKQPTKISSPPTSAISSPKPPFSWGCLRAPTQGDITGPRKRRKGLDEPPPMMDYLIVLDFEWTADNKQKVEPIAEITQFPSVAMALYESKPMKWDDNYSPTHGVDIPEDLRPSSAEQLPRRDAHCVSIFDTFVKPTLNPKMTKFSIELTGITQDDVDRAPTIDGVVVEYMKWLHGLGLVDSEGNRVGNWCFATWGDVDLMSTLRELQSRSDVCILCIFIMALSPSLTCILRL